MSARLLVYSSTVLILIVTCLNLDSLVVERFLDELRSCLVVVLILPASNVEEVLVVALSLTFLGLILLTEVTSARLVTRESVVSHELAHQQEVTQVDSLVELHVETVFASWDEKVGVELLAQLLDKLQASDRKSVV